MSRPVRIEHAIARGWLAIRAFMLAMLVIGVCLLPVFAKATKPGTTIELVRVRDEASAQGNQVLKLPEGIEVTITGKPEAGFFPIEYGEIGGWAPTGSLEIPAHGKADDKAARKERRRAHQVTAGANLNVRAAAAADAQTTGSIRKGDPVALSGEQQDGYLQVTVDGAPGWVQGRYLTASRGGEASGGGDKVYTRAEILDFIYAAADEYGQPREDMQRVARCESDLLADATNVAGGSYGLFQFKPYTWKSTPYGDYDIFDPRANALAAAWMWDQGRKNAWVCQ